MALESSASHVRFISCDTFLAVSPFSQKSVLQSVKSPKKVSVCTKGATTILEHYVILHQTVAMPGLTLI